MDQTSPTQRPVTVRWAIDADDVLLPTTAARAALDHIRRDGSIAHVFDVELSDHSRWRVDLNAKRPAAVPLPVDLHDLLHELTRFRQSNQFPQQHWREYGPHLDAVRELFIRLTNA
jgi:hypothetical protein